MSGSKKIKKRKIKKAVRKIKKPVRKKAVRKTKKTRLKRITPVLLKSRKLTKKDYRKAVSLTNVNEFELEHPLSRREGQLQLRILFYAEDGTTADVTGRSNKMFIGSYYMAAYDLAYKRALAQVDFSPIASKIVSLKFVYWIKK